jgi:hypothetical protein
MMALLMISTARSSRRMLYFQVSFYFYDERFNFDFESSEILDCAKDAGTVNGVRSL